MKIRRAFAAVVVAAGLAGCQGNDDNALSVVVSLPEHYVAGVAKATLVVDYSGTGAKILAEGGGPACAFILPGLDGDFADDRKGTLTIHTSGARALRGPADIAACHMEAGDPEATAADLHDKLSIKVAAAEDSAGKAIDVETKGPKHRDSSGAAPMTETDLEEAQQAAVQAAVSAAPPRVPTPPAPTGLSDLNAVANPGAPPRPVPPPPSAATAGAAAAQKAAKAASAPGNLVQNPIASGAGGNGQANNGNPNPPGSQDRDPSYDDSPADNDKVQAYTVEFAVQTGGTFGALQLEITHLGRSGGFIGRGDKVDCVSLVEAIVASNYLGERTTKVGLISLAGIRTPAAVMRCGFRTSEPLSANSFLIDVTDASDTESRPMEPFPTVVVSSVMRR